MFQGRFSCWKISDGISKEKNCCPRQHAFSLVMLAGREEQCILRKDFPPCRLPWWLLTTYVQDESCTEAVREQRIFPYIWAVTFTYHPQFTKHTHVTDCTHIQICAFTLFSHLKHEEDGGVQIKGYEYREQGLWLSQTALLFSSFHVLLNFKASSNFFAKFLPANLLFFPTIFCFLRSFLPPFSVLFVPLLLKAAHFCSPALKALGKLPSASSLLANFPALSFPIIPTFLMTWVFIPVICLVFVRLIYLSLQAV